MTRDLYVSLGEPVGEGAWVVRVYYKPFVDWIWGGAFLMAIGGVIAVSDRRYRIRSQESGVRGQESGVRGDEVPRTAGASMAPASPDT